MNEFDKPKEYAALPDERDIQSTSRVVPDEFKTEPAQEPVKPKKKSFLMQAASIMAAGVVVTSAFGQDLLGENSFFTGGVSQTVMERELSKSGATEGLITVSMFWSTHDDLDLHVSTPSGEEVFYGNPEAAGGHLDVDKQVGQFVDYPIENIYFDEPKPGKYKVSIVNFTNRVYGDASVLVKVTVRGKSKTYKVRVKDTDYQVDICEFEF